MTNDEDQTEQNMSDEAIKLFMEHLAEFIVNENLLPELLEGEYDATEGQKD